MPIAAAYARVSTQRQTDSQSIESQLERLRAHADAQHWELPADYVFRDDGYSGASLQRPALDHLRDAAASAQLDHILVTAPDRLARNYVHQVLLVEELERHGAAVEFLDRPMSQDPHDQLLLQIRGAVAEYERVLIVERTRRGRLRKLQAGTLLPWTKPPYGYRVDPDHPRDPTGVRVDEAEATVVRAIFRWYAEDGMSLYGLGQQLERLGIASPAGCPAWCPATLCHVLTNPTYIGQVFANRTRSRALTTRRSALAPVGRHSCGKSRREPGEWIAVAPVPALVSPIQFEKAAERLVYNRQMARRNNRAHDYLLRGLVSCGHCRYGCVGRCQQGHYDYYVCRTTTRLRATGVRCPARFIPATALDDLVWRDLCQLLETPEMIAQAMERARGGHWLPQERQARRANLVRGRAALEQQIERLTEAYLAGIVSLEEYKRRRRDAEARLAALAHQEQDLIADIERQSTTASLAAHADAFCQRVRCGLAEADFERRRALVELLIDRVIVTDSEVEIRYVFPTSSKGERQRFCRLRMDYQTRFLNDDDRKHLTGSGARFLLQLRKPHQQAGHIAASHAVLGHLLPGSRGQGGDQPDGATETVCSRGEGGSPSP